MVVVDDDLGRLQRENAKLKEENDILKTRPSTSRGSQREIPVYRDCYQSLPSLLKLVAMVAKPAISCARAPVFLLDIVAFSAFGVVVIDATSIGLGRMERLNNRHNYSPTSWLLF